MKLAIIGSRSFSDYNFLSEKLSEYLHKTSLVVSGGAVGADSLGEKWAYKNNIPTLIFKPDWKKHGRAAGFIRNKLIITEADMVIAFWDGQSKGTKHSIDFSKSQNKPVIIFEI